MKYKVNIDPRIIITKPEEQVDFPVFMTFTGGFNEESAKKFRHELLATENQARDSGQDILPIVIDSYGGDVYALISMIDAIDACEIPIATIVEGKAMSAGAILFSCGAEGHRYIGPNATVMIHDVASGMWHSKVEEIKTQAAECDRLNKIIFERMSKNCGKKKNYFLDLVHDKGHADWYLDSKECLAHNLANHSKLPRFEVDIKMSYKFKL